MARFDSNVAIRIGADFVGIPAFKKADTAVDKLYKSTKKLAAAFGVTFSAAAIGRFGASAVREFANAEREAQTLLGTMKSLNLAFAAPELGAYLDDLERLTGINRGELQPALQKLVTQTGSVRKAQEILNTAVKVSFSGLMDVSTAANALTQAYVGNVKGLRQFNLGLTSTELSLMTFDQILSKVSATYDGQFSEALDSTTVKLNKVRNASENARESIGQGLVNAFSTLAGNGDIDQATSKLEKFGELAGRIIGNLFTPTKVGSFYLPIPALLRKEQQANTIGSPASWRAKNAALAKAEATAAAKAKKIEDAKLATLRKQNAEKVKQAALDAAAAKLASANKTFDLDAIQLAAAAKSATGEDLLRIKLKQDILALEDAIGAKNADLATKLAAVVDSDAKRLAALQAQKAELEKIAKIYDSIITKEVVINFSSSGLGAIIDSYGQLTGRGNLTIPKEDSTDTTSSSTTDTTSSSTTDTTSSSAASSTSSTAADVAASVADLTDELTKDSKDTTATIETITSEAANAITSITNTLPTAEDWKNIFDLAFSTAWENANATPVNITIDGSISNLIDVVVDGLQDKSASGVSTRIERNTGGFNW